MKKGILFFSLLLLISSAMSFANDGIKQFEGKYALTKITGANIFGLEGQPADVKIKNPLNPRLEIKWSNYNVKMNYPLQGCRTDKQVLDRAMYVVSRMIDKFETCANETGKDNLLSGTFDYLGYTDILFVDPAVFMDENKLNRVSDSGIYEIEFSETQMILRQQYKDRGMVSFIFQRVK